MASSPSSPSTPAKSGGPAALPRRTSDETGPVFLDEEDERDGIDGVGGVGRVAGADGASAAGAASAASERGVAEGRSAAGGASDGDGGQPDGAGALPELSARTPETGPAPTWQADPARQAGFGPPGSGDPRGSDPRGGDPRGDWGNDTPADPPPAQGGREHTVGLRRSEVLRDQGSAGQVPAQGTPSSSPSPGGQAQPGQRVPGQSHHGADAGPEQGQGRRVPAQGQSQPGPGSASAQGPQGAGGGVPAQGRVGPGGSGPAQGQQAPGGGVPAQGAPASPSPGQGGGRPQQPAPGQPQPQPDQLGPGGAPAQGSPLPVTGPAQAAPTTRAPASQTPPAQATPAQTPATLAQSPATPAQAPAPAAGPVPDAGLPGAQPSWSQQPTALSAGLPGGAGLPAPGPSGEPDAVVPWRPPANDPFAQLAAARQARPAGLGKRFGARLVDLVLTLAVGAGVTFPFVGKVTDHIDAKVDAVEQAGETKQVWLLDGTTGGYLALVIGVLLVFGVLYEVLPMARWGSTLGKKLFGLSVADIESHDKPSFGKAFLRWLVYGVLGVLVVGVVNLAWCLFDRPWRQCWHDKVAGTFVAKRGAGGSRG
ncbi:RDD family protein [Streptomyces axinellae]|uniref:RDD family protein n=1 Tax=Streptomyces axinellae TaxID=552788 RepID=UPI003CD055B6